MNDSDEDIRPKFSVRNLAPPREPQGYIEVCRSIIHKLLTDTITNTYNQFPAVYDMIAPEPSYKVTGVYLNNSVYTQKEISRKQSGLDESLEECIKSTNEEKAQQSEYEVVGMEKQDQSPEIIQGNPENLNDSFVIIDDKDRKPSFETFLDQNIEIYDDFIQ